VQTRLLRGEVNKDHQVSGRIPVGSRDRPWVGLEQIGKPERGKIRAIHTIREIPCRRFVGASTKLHRATSRGGVCEEFDKFDGGGLYGAMILLVAWSPRKDRIGLDSTLTVQVSRSCQVQWRRNELKNTGH
jgi:hypothetical protein